MRHGRGLRRDEAAAGLCRRLLAFVLALALLAAAWQPAVAAPSEPGAAFSAIMLGDGDGRDAPDGAPGQHCAQCACHAQVESAPAASLPASPVRLAVVPPLDEAHLDRDIPPPSRPPRI